MADVTDLSQLPVGSNDEDGDVCRVCRVEGDELDPLIHPCKCSGSVRFVHPDCLKNWLAHSQKRYCEICGHRYAFTKIYPDFLPAKIPPVVFIRQTLLLLYRGVCHVHRFWLAVLAWLIVLPSLNMITLRTLVWLADTSISYPAKLSTTPLINSTSPNPSNATSLPNATTSAISQNVSERHDPDIELSDFIFTPITATTKVFLSSWRNWYKGDANTLPGFVFRGQILSITLATVLIGLILFREWIVTHNFRDTPPAAAANTEEIKVDDWVVENGVARRINGDMLVSNMDLKDMLELMEKKLRGTDGAMLPDNLPSVQEIISADSTVKSTDEADPASEHPVAGPSQVSLPPSPTAFESDASRESEDRTGVELQDEASNTPPLTSPGGSIPRPCGPTPQADSSAFAYTAPEMLAEKGKGKATDETRQDEKAARSDKEEDVSGGHVDRKIVINPGRRITLEEGEVITFDGDFDRPFDSGKPSTSNAGPSITKNEEQNGGVLVSSAGESSGDTHSSPALSNTSLPSSHRATPPETPLVVGLDLPDDGDDDREQRRADLDVRRQVLAEAERERFQRARAVEDANGLVEGGDDEEGHWDREDWDGILEVVGLKGPIQNLAQNLAFSITIMGAALTLLVGIPIIAGKVVLSMDLLHSLLTTAKLCLRLIRLFTGPIIDFLYEVSRDVILLPLLSAFDALEQIVARKLGFFHSATTQFSKIQPYFSKMAQSNAGNVPKMDTLVAMFVKQVHTIYLSGREISLKLATSDRLGDNIWCMLTGYSLAGLMVVIVALAGESNLAGSTRQIVDSIRQHAMFAKLAVFMGIELIVFPLIIGTTINFCIIPLFQDVTIQSRLADFRNLPFGSIVIGWMIGTIFMFSFASFLSHIRKSIRKGALFFIRDPADQEFSPVKDILERSATSQVRKLTTSAVMYTVVVVSIFGIACWGVRYQPYAAVLPLHTKNMAPLSSIPFDLLFVQLGLPPSMSVMKLPMRGAVYWKLYWRLITRITGLGSMLHGEKRLEEAQAGVPAVDWIWPIIDPLFQIGFGRYDTAATFARVPASDQVALLPHAERRKGGVFVPLDENGRPKNDQDKYRLLRQDQKARQLKRDPANDYTVVWLPAYWRTRIHCFISLAIAAVGLAIAAAFFGPLLLGRAAISTVKSVPVHDGYAMIVGMYICYWLRSLALRAGRYIAKHRFARRQTSKSYARRIKRALIDIYVISMLYLVLPALSGLVFDLHVGVLCRHGSDPDVAPVIHLWDSWAIGLILISLVSGIKGEIRRRRSRSFIEKLVGIFQKPLSRKFLSVSRPICFAVCGLTELLLVPPMLSVLTVLAGSRFGLQSQWNVLIFRHMYHLNLVIVTFVVTKGTATRRLIKLRQEMIDREYVLEERVENYDGPEASSPSKGSVKTIKGLANGDDETDAKANGVVEGEDEWIDEDVQVL